MVPEKRLRVVSIFIVIFALLGGSLYYLLLFNTGITLEERVLPETKAIAIVVGNKSSHVIYNITLTYSDANSTSTELARISSLPPGETKEISLAQLPESLKRIEVRAEAPFHVAVVKPVVLEAARTVRLSISVSTPQTAYVGEQFQLLLTVCNEGDALGSVGIKESHDAAYFAEAQQSSALGAIKAGSCSEKPYAFTPLKTGLTTIYFKVDAADNSQTVRKEITITDQAMGNKLPINSGGADG